MDRGTYSIWSLSATDPPRPRIAPFLVIGRVIFFPGQATRYIVTLVERHTRLCRCSSRFQGRTRRQCVAALVKHIRKLPEHSTTLPDWDHGKELSDHRRFTVTTNVRFTSAIRAVHGSVAPTRTPIGLLRQYFPRGADLSRYSQAHLNGMPAGSISGRARPWRLKPLGRRLQLVLRRPVELTVQTRSWGDVRYTTALPPKDGVIGRQLVDS